MPQPNVRRVFTKCRGRADIVHKNTFVLTGKYGKLTPVLSSDLLFFLCTLFQCVRARRITRLSTNVLCFIFSPSAAPRNTRRAAWQKIHSKKSFFMVFAHLQIWHTYLVDAGNLNLQIHTILTTFQSLYLEDVMTTRGNLLLSGATVMGMQWPNSARWKEGGADGRFSVEVPRFSDKHKPYHCRLLLVAPLAGKTHFLPLLCALKGDKARRLISANIQVHLSYDGDTQPDLKWTFYPT